MKKQFMAFVIGLMMTAMSLVIPTASAENVAKFYNRDEIIEEISKSAEPYYTGNFDLNNDEEINIFDFIEMKKMLINGEPGITVSTLVKLREFLLGINYLFVDNSSTTWFTKLSDLNNSYFENLCSNDFRFVKAETMTYVYTYDNQKYAVDGVLLIFIGCDEYFIANTFMSEFASIDELETIVAEKESFVIGIKNGTYALALKTETEPNTFQKNFEVPVITFDFTDNTLSNSGYLGTAKWFSKKLSGEDPSYAIEALEDGKYLVTITTSLEIIKVTVEEKEFETVKTPIFGNEEFEVYLSVINGAPEFGLIQF